MFRKNLQLQTRDESTPLPFIDLQFSSNRLRQAHVTSLKTHIGLKAPKYYEKKIYSCTPMMKKPLPALIDVQFISNHLK